MRKQAVVDGLLELIRRAEIFLPQDVVEALEEAASREEGVAKTQLETILENIKVARETSRPICQDTGVQTFFVEAGVDFPYLLEVREWLNDAVKQATNKIPIRPNSVDPISGENLGFNIPVINWELTKGDNLLVTVLPKGAGSENMSTLKMLQPNDGLEGVKKAVVETIIRAGGNPCPPTIIGVGIGGTADLAMYLGKKALLRRVGSRHPDSKISSIERELITTINESGIGPMGLGGRTTVLDVHIEFAPRHPASLPVGIVIQCWAHRRATMRIYPDLRWEFL